jgi:hypothetical protein
MTQELIDKYVLSSIKSAGYTTINEFKKAIIHYDYKFNERERIISHMRYAIEPFTRCHTVDEIVEHLISKDIAVLESKTIKYILISKLAIVTFSSIYMLKS